MDKITLGQVFVPVLRFSPVTIIPPLLHTLRLYVAIIATSNYQKDKRAKSGYLPRGNDFSEIGDTSTFSSSLEGVHFSVSKYQFLFERYSSCSWGPVAQSV